MSNMNQINNNSKTIIIASNNAHKVEEIKAILCAYNFEVMTLAEAGIAAEIVEDGTTFEENAYKKAKEIMELTGQICIADDSGLEVYALNGAPGVYSARFAGEPMDYSKNNVKLLEELKNVPMESRGARFVTSLILMFPNGNIVKAEGYVEGKIGFEYAGNNGFGYDPLFIYPEIGKTFAELTSEEKNQISHRGRALAKLKEELDKNPCLLD
jgi:XTP/dITP diphosphohydrolase